MSNLSPANLSTLPIEVFEKIVLLLLPISVSESKSIAPKKWGRSKVKYHYQKTEDRYVTCLHDKKPFLNSLQALGAVNRRLHEMCLPFLWKALSFPGRYSIPMDFWLEKILPKYGNHVEHMVVKLSPDCALSARDLSRSKHSYDNTVLLPDSFSTNGSKASTYNHENFAYFPIRSISPYTLMKLLSLCPNIDLFSLDTSDLNVESMTNTQMIHLLGFLISLTQNLRNVKRLTFSNSPCDALPEEILAAFIGRLPSLTTLDCVNFTMPIETNPKISLASNISRLRHLSRLRICKVAGLNLSWKDYSWSNSLTELILWDCYHISTEDVHLIINHIGTNLIHLWLKCPSKPSEETDTDPQESNAEWLDDDRFELPLLTHLKMNVGGGTRFLSRFQNCQSLEKINYHSVDKLNWNELTELIITNSVWPRLNFANFEMIDYSGEREMIKSEGIFRQACAKAQIELHIKILEPRFSFSNFQVMIDGNVTHLSV